MKRVLLRLVVLVGSTVLFLGAAELLYRWVGPSPDRGALYYADTEHVEFDLTRPEDVVRAQRQFEVVPGAPRVRQCAKPGTTFLVCYHGYEGQAPFDAYGCVSMTHNSWGIRDREELCAPKPAGQTRVVCIGDSTTVGWGVPAEDAWTRRVERILREDDDGLRMVNCGAAGTMLPDEYAYSLFTRFNRFEPDAVLVTLCLNDLLPVNGGMVHYDPKALAANSRPTSGLFAASDLAWGFVRAARRRDALRLDPSRDWVGELLELPVEKYPDTLKPVGRVFWDSGVPQESLRAMRDWCRERGIRFAVQIWPFLQQLETREGYPFLSMHERVARFCADEDIPFRDLLGVFVGLDGPSLWVTERDMHGNVHAHTLASPVIADFVRDVLGR